MKIRLSCILLLSTLGCYAQHSDEASKPSLLNTYQDSLISLSKDIVNKQLEPERYNANYLFIKTLVSALKEPKSFHYGFDSLKSVSIQTSPDQKFRVFSWHIMNKDGSYRYYGSIQMNTPDGKLKLFPLVDSGPFIKNAADTTTSPNKWYGAQYYKIIPVAQPGEQSYYVLLGWKGNTVKSTKKVIEVLYFKDGQAYFGLPVFDANPDWTGKKRIIFEYGRDVSMLLNYQPAEQRIVFDHLAPINAEMKADFSKYGPDMTYDALQLFKGRWKYQQNLMLKNKPSEKDEQFNDPKKLKGATQPIRKY
ncbi:MAG: hypothetical protein ACKOW2_07715 [Sphingobacteriaceae bacterium]